MSKSKAFTLAEILIVLGIIGIIAESTIPSLLASFQKTVYVTQLKVVYTQLSQAIVQMMADEGVMKVSDTNTLTAEESEDPVNPNVINRAGGFLKRYFKVIKDCGTAIPSPCFASAYSSIDRSVVGPPACSYGVIIASGASICMGVPASKFYPGDLFVDVNGPKKPNIAGRDFFLISYYYDGSLDDGVTPECRKGRINSNGLICSGVAPNAEQYRQARFSNVFSGCVASYYGMGCFGKILNDGWKMDY